MSAREHSISRKLRKLDFNKTQTPIPLYTHWCRTVNAKLEGWNPREHAHLFWELHICLQGEMLIRTGGKTHLLAANTFVFLAPKSTHTILYQSESYTELVWGFAVGDEWEVADVLRQRYQETEVIYASDEMLRAVQLILENSERAGFGYFHIIKNELYHVFALLARRAGVKERGEYHKPTRFDLALVKAYLKENLQSDIDVEDVALFLGVSQRELLRFLKQEYNKTFREIKRDVKVETITALLAESELTMEEIAESTGFSDRYAMGKFFKKNAGATPGTYRKGAKK